jgi:hypothetical protein
MSTIRSVYINNESKIPNLLHLSKIYAHGLGKLWKSKTEAARVLAITYPKIRRQHLTAAESLAQLPSEILDLFEGVGLGLWTWRRLIIARKTHGITALLERAHWIKTINEKLSHAEIVAQLISPRCINSEVTSRFDPREIAEAYERGVREGLWSTFHGAGARLGVDRGVINVAFKFVALPLPVIRMFDNKNITYDNCRSVLEIEKACGRKALLERASRVDAIAQDDLSAGNIVNMLAGIKYQSATVTSRIKIPRQRRKIVVEFHCDDSRLLLSRSNELMELIEKGFTAYIDAALATVGASPVRHKK